jgi:ubiquinone biosynthesis protein
LIRRLEEKFPPKGGAPEAPPLPAIPLLTDKSEGRGWLGYWVAGFAGAGAVWGALAMGWIG